MKHWRLFSLAITGWASMFSLCPSAHANGWALTQYTPYGGQHYLYFSHEGMRLAQKKMGITIVAKAPDWKLTMFNDHSKTYFQTTYQDWKQRSAKGQSFVSSFQRTHKFRNINPVKGAAGNIAGMAATQYFVGPKNAHEWQSKPTPGWMLCWLSNDITVPQQMTDILTSQFGLPTMHGVPLKVERIDDHGRMVTDLNTEASQVQNLTASNFTYPANYKRVQEDIEVLVPDDTSQTAADLLNDLSSDPTTQKQLNQLINSSWSTANRAPATTYSRTPVGVSAARPALPKTSASKQSSGDLNSLIDSFLKGK